VDDAVEVATGSSFSCARKRDGTLVCWGAIRGSDRGDPATVLR
jgi:hypothetical protein